MLEFTGQRGSDFPIRSAHSSQSACWVGFRVQGSHFRLEGYGFRTKGFGLRVEG